ncbi:MAG: STAS domain-containing protein [Caldithrix sp.]|nr:STAS domain-containing protein [Caldithrix sp.]
MSQYAFDEQGNIFIIKIMEKRATIDFSGQLKNDILKIIDEGHTKVIIDLSETEYVDSSFLGVLVAGLKKASMKNGDLKIVGLQSPVRAMFELTRLYRIFDIFDNEEDAVKSF